MELDPVQKLLALPEQESAMTEQEQKAVLTLCLMAAFADGTKDDYERDEIKRIADGLAPGSALNLPALYQDVLLKRCSLDEAAGALGTPELRQLAFEMAVCVCDADGGANAAEEAFLERLRAALRLDEKPARAFAGEAAAVAGVPLSEPEVLPPLAVDNAALDKMILNYSILNGALELLPQSLASMAILPLQMKMVYRVGKAYGYELDRGHIKDLLAALGIGLTGQYVEQIGRKLIGGLLGAVAGGLLGGLGSAATGSAFSFATTYALGQVAKEYYAGGRTIDAARLKQVFSSMLDEAKSLQGRYTDAIEQKARTIDASEIARLVREQ
jgi:uncharacterized protein (DUF697 family)/tellurite resistance protein